MLDVMRTPRRVQYAFDRYDRECHIIHANNPKETVDASMAYDGQTVTSIDTIRKIMSVCEPTKDDTVLEMGAGTGYQTKVLSCLSRHVVSYEINVSLYAIAMNNLWKELRDGSVVLHNRDIFRDFHKPGFYDIIIVSFALNRPFSDLLKLLSVGGRAIIPMQENKEQRLAMYIKTSSSYVRRDLGKCNYVNERTDNKCGVNSHSKIAGMDSI